MEHEEMTGEVAGDGLEVAATTERMPRAQAARAAVRALELADAAYDVAGARDILLIVHAGSALTVGDVNAITDAVVDRLHPDAELEVDAHADLADGDEVQIAVALPRVQRRTSPSEKE